jgi:hypothetical protein
VTSPVKKAADYVLDIIVEEFRTKQSTGQHSFK